MGFEVSMTQEFAAAHWLDNYEGNCKNIHGHTWKVEIIVSGEQLNEAGMLVDFREVRKVLASIVARFDHGLLNNISPFDKLNPTAENIAQYIYCEAKNYFENQKIVLVKVWESSSAWASYREDGL